MTASSNNSSTALSSGSSSVDGLLSALKKDNSTKSSKGLKKLQRLLQDSDDESDKESDKSYHQKSYLGFSPDVTFENALSEWPPKRLDQAPIIQEQPVTSFICNPPQNAIVGESLRIVWKELLMSRCRKPC